MIGMDRIRRGDHGRGADLAGSAEMVLGDRRQFFEGFGMTEISGVISVNLPADNKVGTIGKALPGGEIRIATDGEIQYRGRQRLQGLLEQAREDGRDHHRRMAG